MQNKSLKTVKYIIIWLAVIAFAFYLDTKTIIERMAIILPILVVFAYYWLEKKFDEKSYLCTFKKDIYPFKEEGRASFATTLKRKIHLNIIPTIGMKISHYGEDLHEDFFPDEIEKIHYINSAKNFECYVKPFKMTKESDLQSILEMHFENGWNIVDGSQEIRDIFDKWKKDQEIKEADLMDFKEP